MSWAAGGVRPALERRGVGRERERPALGRWVISGPTRKRKAQGLSGLGLLPERIRDFSQEAPVLGRVSVDHQVFDGGACSRGVKARATAAA